MSANINCKEATEIGEEIVALNMAVYNGDAELIDFVVARGTSLEILGPLGMLPIFIVLKALEIRDLNTSVQVMRSLLAVGADPDT